MPWYEQMIDEVSAAFTRLLAVTRITVRGRGSGIEIEARGAQVWEHRDRKLTRVTMYQDRDQAIAEEPPAGDGAG